jgi:peptide/nickel transport system substrate-binding protein
MFIRRIVMATLCVLAVGITAVPGGSWSAVAIGAVPIERVAIRLAGDVDTFDPHRTRSTIGYQFALSMYDRLLSIDANGRVIPYLATKWQVTPNSVTLSLRADATCSDGTKVTPAVVAASLRRLGAPETRAPYAARTFGTGGYQAAGDDGAGTVTVTLNRPFSDLLLGLAMPWASIVCPAGLADPNALATKSFGSGPYVLARSVRASGYTLEARTNYTWGPRGAEAVLPKTLHYRVVGNTTTAANLLLAGGVDIAGISGRDLERVAANRSLFRTEALSFGSDYLLFNQAEGRPGADRMLRTAMAMAIDREGYNKAAYAGQARAITNYITSKVDCFNRATADLVPRSDPNEARAMLQRAGWTAAADGRLLKDGKPIAVKVVGYTAQNAGPEFLFESLRRIGVAATLHVYEFGALVGVYFGSGDWDVTPFPFGPPMPSPNTISPFAAGPVPPQGTNLAHIRNDEFNAAAESGRNTTGPGRCVHWIEAQRALLKNVDIVPLVARVTVVFGRGVEFRMFAEGVIDPFSIRKKM